MLPNTSTQSSRWMWLVAASALAITTTANIAEAQTHAPPPEPFQMVSALVALPDFVPGLGVLYVNPETLPAGPFLGYDRDGKLVNTTYMIPLEAMNEHTAFNDLEVGSAPVDHVDVTFNAGHPGIPEPHYHIVLWHVSRGDAARLR